MSSHRIPDASRYSRHILLQGFGIEGQHRLLDSKVLIIGAGGLGSPCALYLTAAGVGTIGIMDADVVSLSNLQRQIIHFTPDLDKEKVVSAEEKMRAMNPDVKVVTYNTFLTEENAADIIPLYDFILDCTDSLTSKYVVTDACVAAGKPYCAGGVVGYGCQIMTYVPGTRTYRDLFPDPPSDSDVQTSATIGVLGPAVGVMGSIQAAEAIKYIVGIGSLLTNTLLIFDALTMQFQRIEI